MRYDVLYVEGPGDIVAAFDSRRGEVEHASETAFTYSSQLFSHCRDHALSLLAVTYGSGRATREAGVIRVESRPRRMLRVRKIGYHLSLFRYAFRILGWELRYRPRLILLKAPVHRLARAQAAYLREHGARLLDGEATTARAGANG